MSLDVSFNGTYLSSFGLGLLSYKVPSGPSLKNKGIDVPGADGIFRTKPVYSSDEIVLTVVAESSDASGVHSNVRAFLSWLSQLTYGDDAEDFKVIFSDDNSVFRYAAYNSADDYYVTTGIFNAMTKFDIHLSMANPFVYDVNLGRYDTVLASGSTFIVNSNTSIHSPFSMYLFKEGSYTVAQACGTGQTFSSTTEYASGFEISVNGVEFTYSGKLYNDGIIKVDTQELSITNNGISDLQNFDGYMPELKYGENAIVMTNTQSVSIHIVVEFYRRWL